MIKVGITGGIGGGKSVFSRMLQEKGFLVYNTDLEARKLQDNDVNIKTQIIQEFGDNAYDTSGALNRKYIASIVFNNSDKLRKLNSIVHPVVKQDLLKWYSANITKKLLFVECAILFEGGFDAFVDKIVLVTAAEELRVQRVMNRDGITEHDVRLRVKEQLPEIDKITRADYIIHTDNNLTDDMIMQFLEQLLA